MIDAQLSSESQEVQPSLPEVEVEPTVDSPKLALTNGLDLRAVARPLQGGGIDEPLLSQGPTTLPDGNCEMVLVEESPPAKSAPMNKDDRIAQLKAELAELTGQLKEVEKWGSQLWVWEGILNTPCARQ